MDAFDDLHGMALPGLDANLAELLMTGAVDPDDAPPEFGRVAALIKKAQEPANADELSGRAATVMAFAARARACSALRARTKRMLPFQTFPAKVLAVAIPFVLLGGGVATATGSLPASAQAAVSRVLSTIGISVPSAPSDNDGTAALPNSSTGGVEPNSAGPGAAPVVGVTAPIVGVTTPVNGATAEADGATAPGKGANVGLCRAWKAGDLNRHDIAYSTLVAAAGGSGSLTAYCRGLLTSPPPGGPTGQSKNLSAGQPATGHAASKASTTGNQGSAFHRGVKPNATALPPSSVVARGGSGVATPKAPPTSLRGHRRKAPGTSPLAAAPSPSPATAAPLASKATHVVRTAAGHGRSTKTGQLRSRGPKSSTPVTPTTSPSGSAQPVWSSVQVGHGPHKHHGQTGPRRQRGCSGTTRPRHVVQPQPRCQPATSNATSTNAPSTASGPPVARQPRHAPTVVAKPHSVKHRAAM
jgi:hypothetical protein